MTLRSVPSARVPVLTEVVEYPVPARDAEVPTPPATLEAEVAPAAPAASFAPVAPFAPFAPLPPLAPGVPATTPAVVIAVAAPLSAPSSAQIFDLNEAQLTQRILADVQRQVELMLEFRVREALMPALARATDALVKDARDELATALKDIVTRAVSQELARHRLR